MYLNKAICFSKFITNDEATRKIIEQAKYCAKYSYDSVWIVGNEGTGKTLLARMIASNRTNIPVQHNNFHDIVIPFGKDTHPLAIMQKNCQITLFINILKNVTVKEIKDFQQNLATLLHHNRLSVEFICFMSLPTDHYTTNVEQHLHMMQKLFIERQRAFIRLPDLMQRKVDIVPLVEYFLGEFAYANQRHPITLHKDAKILLPTLQWLKNVKDIHSLCYHLAQSPYSHIMPEDIMTLYRKIIVQQSLSRQEDFALERATMTVSLLDKHGRLRPFEKLEEEIFAMACQYRRGSKTSAARELQVGRTTLYRKLKTS